MSTESTPVMMKNGTLVPFHLEEEKPFKKRKLPVTTVPEIVDETHGDFGSLVEPFRDQSVKYSVVWNKLTKHRDGSKIRKKIV